MRILMVCLGNICRSPLAEGILQKKVEDKSLGWEVKSAGTSHWHQGEKPDPRSIHTASRHGLDITGQRARQLKPDDLQDYDLILAMDETNYRDILRFAKTEQERSKVRLILEYIEAETTSVPDPYWDDDGFEKVYQMLEKACDGVIAAHSK